MSRRKGTPNPTQEIINKIVKKHENGISVRELLTMYEKPYKTIKNMITRENNKKKNITKLCKIRERRNILSARCGGSLKYRKMANMIYVMRMNMPA